MTTTEDLRTLIDDSNVAVFTTYRRDGMPQQSLVSVGLVDGALAFTTRSGNAKVRNLARDYRCAAMLISANRRAFAVLDGLAEVLSAATTGADVLRVALQDVYRSAAGAEHPDWDDYDRAMLEQGRVAVILRPSRIVGHNIG